MNFERGILMKRKIIMFFIAISVVFSAFTFPAFASKNSIQEVHIYYPDGDWHYVPVAVNVDTEAPYKDALNQLVKGINIPNDCYNEFPQNTEINTLNISGDTATVTFNDDLVKQIDNINYSIDVMKEIISKNMYEFDTNLGNIVLNVGETTLATVDLATFSQAPFVPSVDAPHVDFGEIVRETKDMTTEEASNYIIEKIKPLQSSNQIAADLTSATQIDVCIDPGHGGSSLGATGTLNGTTYYEKNMNLDIALSLGYWLNRLGYSSIFTRTTDIDVTLTQRYTAANNNNVRIFVSTHCNSSIFPWENGVSVIYPSNHNINESYSLASLVDTSVVFLSQYFSDIGPYQDTRGLAVLNATNMPAIITETGHVSYASDLNYIINNTWYIGEYISAGIYYYLG